MHVFYGEYSINKLLLLCQCQKNAIQNLSKFLNLFTFQLKKEEIVIMLQKQNQLKRNNRFMLFVDEEMLPFKEFLFELKTAESLAYNSIYFLSLNRDAMKEDKTNSLKLRTFPLKIRGVVEYRISN